MREISSFIERAEKSIKRRYYKDPKAPIKSSDPDAVERLEAKIASYREWQETMKAANSIIRKAKGDEEKARAGLLKMGISEQNAAQMLTPDYCGRIGFPSWQLSNNLAEIKRLESRLVKVKKRRKQHRKKLKQNQEFALKNALRTIESEYTSPENRKKKSVPY